MKIELKNVTIRELVDGFSDNGEGGVRGYNGKLDIRPPYQREFVYKDEQRAAVINTVRQGFPLNVMYWADREDGTYEVMDGQQRTISICQYHAGDFSFDFGRGPKYFYNLSPEEQQQFLDYKLFVYVCTGTEPQKLDWFETINIVGEKLTKQELRNAVYHGTWLSDAKRWFSRVNGPADATSDGYVNVKVNRQELLEVALNWIILRDNLVKVDDYMALHQKDANATDLWNYFENVMRWAKSTFPKKRTFLKQVDWGKLYYEFGDTFPNADELENRVAVLIEDDDVQRKAGIYSYVLDGDTRHLNLRAFSTAQKAEAYERQKGICANASKCLTPNNTDGTKVFKNTELEADHITPWSKGGRTVPDNCQLLCLPCNRRKSSM